MCGDKEQYTLNFARMEDLFSVDNPDQASRNRDSTSGDTGTLERKKSDEVNLLDGKRSLNVNIFLRQFRIPHPEIVELLAKGESETIGSEKIRGLLKILPDNEEVEMLRGFAGDATKLGGAEKFLNQLISLPSYKLRVEAMLVKEEFNNTLDWIKPALDAVILTAGDLKESGVLREIIYMVAMAGNFLNAGGYSGDAAAFKLGSLVKLTETRANKPRMNLMHYVVMEAEQNNPKLLKFPEEFKYLKEAAQYSIDSLMSDITSLQKKIESISEQIEATDADFQAQIRPFLKDAKLQMSEFDQDLQELEELRLQLAEYFCEDEKTFQLQECITIFDTFCEKFKKAITENKERKSQEEKAEQRRKQREEMLQNKRRPSSATELKSSDISDDRPRSTHSDGAEPKLVDELIGDIRSGFSGEARAEEKVRHHSGELKPDSEFSRSSSFRSSGRRSSINRLQSIEESKKANEDDKRTRKNSDMADSDLFDYLLQSEDNSEKMFDRTGSLRGRRRRGVGARALFDRERASSPLTPDHSSEHRRTIKSDPDLQSPFERHSTLRSSGPAAPQSTSSSIQRQSPLVTTELAKRRNVSATQLDSLAINTKAATDAAGKESDESKNVPSKEALNEEKMKEREKRRSERRRRSHLEQTEWQSIANESKPFVSSVSPKSPASPKKNIQNILAEKHINEVGSKTELNKSITSDMNGDIKNKSGNISLPPGVDSEAVAAVVRRNRDRNMTSSQSSLNTPPSAQSLECKKNRRWSAMDHATDINEIIRDVEKTGREIDKIGENDPEWTRNNRWANHQNGLGEQSSPSTQNRQRYGTDSGFGSEGSVSEQSVTSPDSPSKAGSSPMKNGVSPLRQRLDDKSVSTITSRAMEDHCKGSWKKSETDGSSDVTSPTPDSASHLGVSFKDRMNNRKMRPYSTYDNVPGIKYSLDKTNVSHSSGDISDVTRRTSSSSSDVRCDDGDTSPVTKRWGRVFDDEKESAGSNLRRSNTLPRKWRNRHTENDKRQPDVIVEEDKLDGKLDDCNNKNKSSVGLIEEEEGYCTMERNSLPRKSMRISKLSKNNIENSTTIEPVQTSAWRKNVESEQLDSKVHEFQSRSAHDTRSSVRKAKFKELSTRYSDNSDDLWAPTSKTVAQNTDTVNNNQIVLSNLLISKVDGNDRVTDSGNFSSSSSRPNSLNLDPAHSPRGVPYTDDPLNCKSDTESVVSGRDEGFESESVSDPSVSQRTSMSSTLESELAGTPTLGRKDYNRQTEDEQESTYTQQFSRSIDSLVHKSELTLGENIDIDSSDKTPTSESKGLEVWREHDNDKVDKVKKNIVKTNTVMTKKPDKKSTITSPSRFANKTTKPMTPKFHTTSRLTSKSSTSSSATNTSPVKTATLAGRPTAAKVNKASPSNSGSTTPTKSKASPAPKSSTAAAVTARLARPKRPLTTLKREGSNSSLASETSSTSNVSNTTRRSARPARPGTATTPPAPKVSVPERPSSASTASSRTATSASSPFVRGVGTRATMPASMLRANKKVAAESRESNDVPVPPRRTSSIRASASERLSMPKKPSPGVSSGISPRSSTSTLTSPGSPSVSRARRTTVGVNPKNTGFEASKTRSPADTTSPRSGTMQKTSVVGQSKPSDPLKKKVLSPRSTATYPVTSPNENKKSPSFIKKIIDKSKERKSPLNKSDISPTKTRVTIKSPMTSSRC